MWKLFQAAMIVVALIGIFCFVTLCVVATVVPEAATVTAGQVTEAKLALAHGPPSSAVVCTCGKCQFRLYNSLIDVDDGRTKPDLVKSPVHSYGYTDDICKLNGSPACMSL